MAKNQNQQDAPEAAALEGIRIPKSLMPTAKITHAGRVKKRKEKQTQEDGTVVEVEVEDGGTIDKKDHEYRRQVPALTIDGEDGAAFQTAVDAYLALNKALSQKGAMVVIRRPNGTEQLVPTKDPEDKGADGQQDGRTLIPCKGLPTTYADLVNSINEAVDALHKSEQNARLTADFAVKPGKKAKATVGDDGAIPDDVQY